jgi:hypothetical protein
MARYVLINEITDGMVLSEPIVNTFGQTLLPFGAELVEKHIKIFKTWNITGLMIKSENDETDDEITPEQKYFAIERLRKRMSWAPKNLLEKDLIEMAIYKIIKLSKVN